jgi:hypothetical protein
MRHRRHHRHDHATTWLWALALAVLAGGIGVARRASASVIPPPGPGRSPINPRTGRPIVTRGSHTLSDAELQTLIAAQGFADAAKAFAIAKRESGGSADVVVDTRGMSPTELAAYWGKPALEELSVGLFQVNVLANGALVMGASADDKANTLKDAATNAHVALVLSHGGTSWGPWGG